MTAQPLARSLTPEPAASLNLAHVLANRHWRWRAEPFPHVVAERVFTDEVYASFAHELRSRLEGTWPADGPGFHRNMRGYDALGMDFHPGWTGPLRFFLSRAWHDCIAEVFGVAASGHVSGGLHHHKPGSASGQIHNDLNPGWFAEYESADGIMVTRPDVCRYATGETEPPGLPVTEVVRGVAVLFYLENLSWSPGDGGTTGLYRGATDNVEVPVLEVAPRDNTLLAFECTPTSFHSFVRNRRHPRNSLIYWLHRPKADVVARWGEAAIVHWSR